MTKREPIVTDHAIVRYLEEAHGLDIAVVRQHIAGLTANGIQLEAVAVQVEGVRMHLAGAAVTTVSRRRRKKMRADRREVREAP